MVDENPHEVVPTAGRRSVKRRRARLIDDVRVRAALEKHARYVDVPEGGSEVEGRYPASIRGSCISTGIQKRDHDTALSMCCGEV